MKVYFGASISYSRKFLPKYQLIVQEIKKLGHNVLSEHVIDPKIKPGQGMSPKKLFQKQINVLKNADLMIAEVTVPSWGTAFLMEQALKQNIPVVALFYKDNGAKIPNMIQGHPELYSASYDEDNIASVLEFNSKHFASKIKRIGKLIVIDGANGSGKSTQVKMLLRYFQKINIAFKHISFPRYYTSFHGKTVARFLTGEFGRLGDVSPYLSSLAFALDRLTSKNQILGWLNAGQVVVADRYVTSSLAHQAAKLSGKERRQFNDWLYDMEYKQHRMPKEDLMIYLYIPPEISDMLITQKNKKYKKGNKKDIEEGLVFQKKVVKIFLELCRKNKHWIIINCVDKNGNLKSKEKIHQLIVRALKSKKIVI